MKRAIPLLAAAAVLLVSCNGAEHVGGSPRDAMAIAEALGVFVQVTRLDGVPTGGVMQVDIEPLFGSSGVLGG